jgi:hypothetical protein
MLPSSLTSLQVAHAAQQWQHDNASTRVQSEAGDVRVRYYGLLCGLAACMLIELLTATLQAAYRVRNPHVQAATASVSSVVCVGVWIQRRYQPLQLYPQVADALSVVCLEPGK